MPSLRLPAARSALQPSARALPRTQPFLTQIRHYEKGMEPNDGGKSQAKPKDKGTTGGYNLDGTSSMGSGRGLLMIGAATALLGGVWFMFFAKPDTVTGTALKNDPGTVKHSIGTEKQREGGPQRSEK